MLFRSATQNFLRRTNNAGSIRSMSATAKVWVDKNTRVICQGFTGKQVCVMQRIKLCYCYGSIRSILFMTDTSVFVYCFVCRLLLL